MNPLMKGTLEHRYAVLALAFWLGLGTTAHTSESTGKWVAWYTNPAATWVEALPVGNGRLGAMVFGGTPLERIQFNESTLWIGEPRDYSHPGAAEHLGQIRELLFQGRQKEAEDLAMRVFMSIPLRQMPYQPFGDVWIEFPGHTNLTHYKRQLDLETAVASVRYVADGVQYRREVLASHPHNVIAMHLTASEPGKLAFNVRLTTPHTNSTTTISPDGLITIAGELPRMYGMRETNLPISNPLRFEARLAVRTEPGRASVTTNGLTVSNATTATLLLTAATSFSKFDDVSGDPRARCDEVLARIGSKPWTEIKSEHVRDHQALFNRVDINLGQTPAAALPTDARLRQVTTNADPALAALFFQFGRYLMIASSRPGGQPANLQGIWNDQLRPPWDSKWTLNINCEMNYWPAEVCNLSECHTPLFDMIRDLSVTGARVAHTHYNARGWVVHHNTDLWRGAAPINHANHGIWPTGGAWLCQHLWWHYEFTGDVGFLREAYPLMRQAALFFVDFLIEDPRSTNRWLISTPSNSPEQGGLVAGPTMDHQIIRSLFDWVAQASRILNVDAELRTQLEQLRRRIAPNQIGKHGQLQEWLEDIDDPNNKHRHVSHLWGVFPGEEITPDTPELFKAARVSLEFRGDGGTGWSKAWKICLWARLLDGNRAHKLLTEALAGNTYPNLFDAHPPFQIDGNFGATAGIAEMLLQSHRRATNTTGESLRCLDLLPALPSAWPTGHVTGLCARGGATVDLVWRDGRIASATITASQPGTWLVRYKNTQKQITLRKGQTFHLRSFDE